ncbi:MAG: sulfurtransferase [Pirellulales bacterium]|nr:sulfurtransferase [Pirellulales bacterium]
MPQLPGHQTLEVDMSATVNIAAYHFAELACLPELRVELRNLCNSWSLRGTILLAPEGINMFVAGSREGVDALLERVRQIPGLAEIVVKSSFSSEQPFNRMLVKIKREIIAFGVEGIEPAKYTSPRITAQTLKEWLDEGRPVTLLDTRNNFELEAGTFANAVAIGVDEFRDFPRAVDRLPEEMKEQTIVTFCTGGIRCEKAAPYMQRQGFNDVYQLDGGILKYLEECGNEHYEGECFVFDKRVAVDADLKESELRQCFVCRALLSPAELASEKYVEGVSCPQCYQTPKQSMQRLLEQRHEQIRKVTTPLPGSVPYDNIRPISVPLRCDRMELLDFLEEMNTGLSRDEWQEVCSEGQLACNGQQILPGTIVRSGQRLQHNIPATTEPDVNAQIEILYEDEALVVVNKPAPLPMHPCGRFNRNSLVYILRQVYPQHRLRPAHRLDADTSGIVVLSKTRQIARLLQQQFETGAVHRKYLARVHGHPSQSEFDCQVAINSAPGENGVRLPDAHGLAARTRFRVVHTNDDGTTLLEVTPETGRTNQIRIHLWSLGLPIVGDSTYLPDKQLGTARTNSLDDQPLCLHAHAVEVAHPTTGKPLCIETRLPEAP